MLGADTAVIPQVNAHKLRHRLTNVLSLRGVCRAATARSHARLLLEDPFRGFRNENTHHRRGKEEKHSGDSYRLSRYFVRGGVETQPPFYTDVILQQKQMNVITPADVCHTGFIVSSRCEGRS